MAIVAFISDLLNCLSSRDGTCVTTECRMTASMLTMNMMSTDPALKPNACQNFYAYACGSFRTSIPLPPGRNSIMMADYHENKMNDKLKELLGRANNDGDPNSLQRVRQNYRECLENSGQSTAPHSCLRRMKKQHPKAIVYLLVQELNGREMRSKVQQILEEVKKSFENKINKSWMDTNARAEAIRKIRSVRSLIFFTDDMLDVRTLDQPDIQRHVKILGNSCEYISDHHIIGVPITATGIPFYNYGLESMDYGSIAYAMGHELGHMFDDNEKYKDSNNRRSNWWTPWMEQQYRERALGFVNQYAQFTVNGIRVNGGTTLTENVQDNVGFDFALDAYRSQRRRQKKLTRFEEFSAEQLFTLAFASIHCENLSAWYVEEQVGKYHHAPGLARVNGVVMNSREFSTIWNCSPTDPMNPPNKNDIWARTLPIITT